MMEDKERKKLLDVLAKKTKQAKKSKSSAVRLLQDWDILDSKENLKYQSKADKRDNTIDEVLRHYGLSVIIRNETEFNHIKKFLGEDVLYLDFVPQMSSTETAIVIWSDNIDFAPGSVGKSDYHKSKFFRLVEFSDFFKA